MSDELRDIAPGPEGHFQLWFYAAVLRLITRLDTAATHFPFLEGYAAGLQRYGVSPAAPGAAEAWETRIAAWERRPDSRPNLPLLALREHAGLSCAALTLLMLAGLPEEDARFGDVFAALNGDPARRRPTAGLLGAWWDDHAGGVRAALRELLTCGLLHVPNAEAPRSEWILQPPGLLWECLQGEPPPRLAAWADYRAPEQFPHVDDLILDPRIARELAGVPGLLANGAIPALLIRGPQHNGRRTLAGALARATGRGLLLVEGLGDSGDPRWRVVGPLTTALGALPAIVADPAPGEVLEVPELPPYNGPVAVVAGPHGGLRGPLIERGLSILLALPDPVQRREHWRRALCAEPGSTAPIDELSTRFRLTGGNIRRVAAAAGAIATLDGRSELEPADARRASHALGRQTLDTLASFVAPGGDTQAFVAGPETMHELELLEAHCRHRERLAGALGVAFGGQHTCGVRALFSGPSGAGKTLAARRLAAALDRDLYRIDLSAVVNKYIGETEKNLGRVLARAEELDVVLLLDEGDALLTRRTSVHSANDRYANLETNFLLQRLESFEGILIVTTNAAQRVDEAFQRRMDAVIVFGMPEPEERLAIWHAHLPAAHGLAPIELEEVAYACALSGGQIRNAARYAGLLALESDRTLDGAHVIAALQREYRKAGAVCPLPGMW